MENESGVGARVGEGVGSSRRIDEGEFELRRGGRKGFGICVVRRVDNATWFGMGGGRG